MKPTTLRSGGEGEMVHNWPRRLIRPDVADGSFASFDRCRVTSGLPRTTDMPGPVARRLIAPHCVSSKSVKCVSTPVSRAISAYKLDLSVNHLLSWFDPGQGHQTLFIVAATRRSHHRCCPAICAILIITNSAGLNGAKPTRILTMPLSIS